MKPSNPLKWHGGKTYLAAKILALMPPRCANPNDPADDDAGWLHYVEPYFGGGAVLFAQNPEGISEVANDVNLALSNFWRVLASPQAFAAFSRRIAATPFSALLFKLGKLAESIGFSGEGSPEEQSVEAAVAFFVKYRQSRQAMGKDFATLTRNRTRRGMNEQVAAWLSAIDGLADAHERLQRVVILCEDAVKVIKQQDGPRTFFYFDPPYMHETRVTTKDYTHEMSVEQHVELLDTLAAVRGRFILSGYPSELYQSYAERNDWRFVDVLIDNKASSKATKEKKTERLWMNYEPPIADEQHAAAAAPASVA